jgi:hypothetical protein
MAMDTHYFTFDQTNIHPDTGKALAGYWVEIAADSSDKANRKMFELFGNQWKTQYCERQFMKCYTFFPKGCYARFEVD